jgi:peptidoglycan/xylan/chitin deacetylase (PgdA/CDA1 family)
MSAVVNAFSVDVEDYFQVSALASAIPRETWSSRDLRVERNTAVLLDLLAERGLHGTFFVLGWIADRCPALVKRIAAAGHEVASHGYSHRLIYNQTQAEFHAVQASAGRSDWRSGYRISSRQLLDYAEVALGFRHVDRPRLSLRLFRISDSP